MKIIFKSSKKNFISAETKKDALLWFDEDYCLKAVEQDGYALRYVNIQTEAICLKAVERNGDALQYVNIKSDFISVKD